ncbi:hypothetical protein G7B40_015405 [Aetokthonos hydrillicola Thurmond2011]|jgi:deoxycytidine triphosphate deaminase/cell division septum initiation protein DivIVA|uniref:Deoxycytidine triphosphate deaminase n=1 Tax=Aetokthonos hydrillicola Thurmond2011 TaxID=2712845 RepID=A0AAP5M877_9CYAN|nr:hypothetical protein [Aetokthonos hydrillicola]MBO3461661.1 hypothetical protein [Aetokthonos hydrillicola CCALA 1050]MBW4588726.1 hypothetical protein [Aetokthonos hydrillicola CCALA 1050]MDR9895940.1 hypothetical protein [Aetokthonos hydrillicola Thurmond2011]
MSNTSQSNTTPNSPFATTDQQAELRFQNYKSQDAFPEILPALLNSADVYDYVAKTGMIFPFDKDKLKPASYEVNLLGKCVYCNDEGKKQIEYIDEGKEFILRKNSIAFVTLEPIFRLPDYIALRFNLKITHVYRGLLLGTGPLVDPGFVGRLSIPLHNLTTNDYIFRGGEPLIWIEFTKLSPNRRWKVLNKKASAINRQGQYIPFPANKNKLSDVEEYLRKADPHRSIRSSIPDAIQDAKNSAQAAAKTVQIFTIAGTVGGLISASIVGYSLFDSYKQSADMVQTTNSYTNAARKELYDFQKDNSKNENKISSLEKKIQELENRIKELENGNGKAVIQSPVPKSSSATIRNIQPGRDRTHI